MSDSTPIWCGPSENTDTHHLLSWRWIGGSIGGFGGFGEPFDHRQSCSVLKRTPSSSRDGRLQQSSEESLGRFFKQLRLDDDEGFGVVNGSCCGMSPVVRRSSMRVREWEIILSVIGAFASSTSTGSVLVGLSFCMLWSIESCENKEQDLSEVKSLWVQGTSSKNCTYLRNKFVWFSSHNHVCRERKDILQSGPDFVHLTPRGTRILLQNRANHHEKTKTSLAWD